MGSPRRHQLLGGIKRILVDDLQFGYTLRCSIAIVELADIDGIFDDTIDGGVGKIPSIGLADTQLGQIAAQTLCAVAFVNVFIENQLNNLCGIIVNGEVADLSVALIDTATLFQTIAVWDRAAGE